MILPKTSIIVEYVKPQLAMTEAEKKKQLTKFISLFAQVGFREYALNEDFANEINNYCK